MEGSFHLLLEENPHGAKAHWRQALLTWAMKAVTDPKGS